MKTQTKVSASQIEGQDARFYREFWSLQAKGDAKTNQQWLDAQNKAQADALQLAPVICDGLDRGIPYATGEDRIPSQ